MNHEEIKQSILAFLKTNQLAVVSTVDAENRKPEAACVAFAEKENLELIFGTSNRTRKYQNLQHNKNVAFVIGWAHEFGTVQYEGVAQELLGDEAIKHGTIMAEKNESTRRFLTREDHRYFLVRPTWIRFVDKSKNPEVKSEISFTN